MDVQFWAATDVGRVREHNEDNFLVDKRLSLFIVCDGMGGHAAGEVASAVAVRAIREVVANNRAILDQHREAPDDPRLRQELLKLLEYAVQEACTRIYDMAQQNPERRGMGTTCSLLMLGGRRSFIAHVGDSRIYLVRRGQVHQLTEDHSLMNEMLRRGRLQDGSEPPIQGQYKNAITRAVGVYESVEVDTLDFDNLPGDRFLLCSDGLSMYLDVEGIIRFVAPRDESRPTTRDELKIVVEELIAWGNSRGGKDNITAVLIGLNEDSEDRESEDIRLTMETMRNIPLFHYLNYKELVRIINVTQKRRVAEGERVIHEGETGDELFIILRGEFVVERAGTELARLGSGRHFGEMALVDDRPRSASVRCTQDGTVLTISRPEFYELLRKDPSMAVKLLWNFIQTLSSRLRDNLTLSVAPAASPRSSGGFRAARGEEMWPILGADVEELDTDDVIPTERGPVSPTAITPEQGIAVPPLRTGTPIDLNPALAATIPPGAGLRSPFIGARKAGPPGLVEPGSGPIPPPPRVRDDNTPPHPRIDLRGEGNLPTEPSLTALSRSQLENSGEFPSLPKRHRHRRQSDDDED